MSSFFEPVTRHDFIIPVLGVMPLLMVTDTVVTGTAIGVINLSAVVLVCIIVSSIRNLLIPEIRLTVILLVSASVVTLIGLLVQAWFYEIARNLGIYIYLVAVNCLLLAWAEEYALRHGVFNSLVHSLLSGVVMLMLLIMISLIREYSGLSFLKQSAGAFLVLALFMAIYNRLAGKSGQSA